MKIFIGNAPNKNIRKESSRIAEKFLGQIKISPKAILNIAFVSQDKIRALNKKYRQKDQVTSVLSFPVWRDIKQLPRKGTILLGDIYICPSVTEEKEITSLVVHSLNHLIGKHH